MLIITAGPPLVDRAIIQNAARVNEAAGDGLDANTRELSALTLRPIEELDLLEALACVLGAVAQGVSGAVPAREESTEVGAQHGVD